MIVTISNSELPHLQKACALVDINCEVLINESLTTVMLTDDGEEITHVMCFRLGMLTASNEEQERLAQLGR